MGHGAPPAWECRASDALKIGSEKREGREEGERGRRERGGCWAAVLYGGEQPPGRRPDTTSARWTGSPTLLRGGGAAPPTVRRPDTPARGAGSPTRLRGFCVVRWRTAPPGRHPDTAPARGTGADY